MPNGRVLSESKASSKTKGPAKAVAVGRDRRQRDDDQGRRDRPVEFERRRGQTPAIGRSRFPAETPTCFRPIWMDGVSSKTKVLRLSLAAKGVAKVLASLGEIGLDIHRLAKKAMASSIRPARCNAAKPRLFCASASFGLSSMARRKCRMASSSRSPQQCDAEVVVGLGIVGLECQGLLILRDGLVGPGLLCKSQPKIVVRLRQSRD